MTSDGGDRPADLFAAQEVRAHAIRRELERAVAERAPRAFEYRCEHRPGSCLLASVYLIEGTHVAYAPRYRLPGGVPDEEWTIEGLVAHGEADSDRWRHRAIDLNQLASWGDPSDGKLGAVRVTLRCRHVSAELDPAQMIADAEGEGDHARISQG